MKRISLTSQYRLISIIIALIILYFVSLILILELASRYLKITPWSITILFHTSNISLSILLFIVFNRLYMYFKHQNIILLPPHASRSKSALLIQGLGFSLLWTFAVAVAEQIFFGTLYEKNLILLIYNTPLSYWAYNIFPAISEEILFRAGLIHAFYVIGKRRRGLLVSGIIFGLFHLMNLRGETIATQELIWIFNLMCAGVILGYLYIRFGLLISIFAHWFWNTSWGNTMQQVEQSLVSTVVFVSFIVLFEMLSYREKKSRI